MMYTYLMKKIAKLGSVVWTKRSLPVLLEMGKKDVAIGHVSNGHGDHALVLVKHDSGVVMQAKDWKGANMPGVITITFNKKIESVRELIRILTSIKEEMEDEERKKESTHKT